MPFLFCTNHQTHFQWTPTSGQWCPACHEESEQAWRDYQAEINYQRWKEQEYANSQRDYLDELGHTEDS